MDLAVVDRGDHVPRLDPALGSRATRLHLFDHQASPQPLPCRFWDRRQIQSESFACLIRLLQIARSAPSLALRLTDCDREFLRVAVSDNGSAIRDPGGLVGSEMLFAPLDRGGRSSVFGQR